MPDAFIDAAFRLGPDLRHESAITRADYADRIVRGGLPEAVARTDPRRRGRFHDSYVQNLIDRDVRQLSEIERTPQLTALIRLLATRSGHIVPPAAWNQNCGYPGRPWHGTCASSKRYS
jgi:predicted AAA+ superfamily ATPase